MDVPVTASVIRWAIAQSGYAPEELDSQIRVSPGTVRRWARGDADPNWTELKRLAGVLKRPVAAFFLPDPPTTDLPAISFRSPPGATRKKANPQELRYIREASRLQRVLAWLRRETENKGTDLPRESISASPADVAVNVRQLLGVSAEQQSSWGSPSVAFDEWRKAFEKLGIYVFLFSLGPASSKGFSLWNDTAPVIAANTHWNDAARVFTLFHELGHLVTRTSSVCLNPANHVHVAHGDAQERWCETFASGALIPSNTLKDFLQQRFRRSSGKKISRLEDLKSVANHFNVSLRAAALRLIEAEAAMWDLYTSLPPVADNKRQGGGGSGRVRREIREDSFGRLTAQTFVTGVKRDLISHYDALTYLNISYSDFSAWERGESGRARP